MPLDLQWDSLALLLCQCLKHQSESLCLSAMCFCTCIWFLSVTHRSGFHCVGVFLEAVYMYTGLWWHHRFDEKIHMLFPFSHIKLCFLLLVLSSHPTFLPQCHLNYYLCAWASQPTNADVSSKMLTFFLGQPTYHPQSHVHDDLCAWVSQPTIVDVLTKMLTFFLGQPTYLPQSQKEKVKISKTKVKAVALLLRLKRVWSPTISGIPPPTSSRVTVIAAHCCYDGVLKQSHITIAVYIV